ncbi:hypothetical protein PHET_05867 [Paragonimus heterotremus]|uniref:Uncharacterized protein n=1 Tax=Paragonimus heterotremus TaxID=100268 RepID=A0A8J4WRB2_9TREM|nr:hypothetical protein PHET_05867 [Paragonimus heterotremus]
MNKSSLTSKWSAVRIQSTTEEFDHTEYLICRMEFTTSRYTESLRHRLQALCKQAQWWITKYLVHQIIDKQRPKEHSKHKTTSKKNWITRKSGGTLVDSISAPCMFRHIRTITEEEMKFLI